MSKTNRTKKKRIRTGEICRCPAYLFPHRLGSGTCEADVHGITTTGVDELLDDPRRGEAREINRENNRSR